MFVKNLLDIAMLIPVNAEALIPNLKFGTTLEPAMHGHAV